MAKKPLSQGKVGSVQSTQPPLPDALAILICEKVIMDAISGNVTIVGVRSRFDLNQFPVTTPSFFVFAQLARGMGNYGMTIEVQDDQKGVVIGRSQTMHLEFPSNTEVRDIIIQIPPVPLKHAGSYTVALFVNGDEVGHQCFNTR